MAGGDDSQGFGRALTAMLDDQRRTAVSDLLVSTTRAFARNETIFSAGDPGREMFVLTRGRVRLHYEDNLGETVGVAELSAGESFGEVALMDGEPQPFNAVALEDAEVVVLGRRDLEELIGRYPHLAIALLAENGRWIRRLARQLRDQSVDTLETRLEESRSFAARIADRVARLLGHPSALGAFGLAILAWLYFGQFGMQGLLAFPPFDPFPFLSLNTVMTIIAAVQAPIILMVLNRLADRERIKSDFDARADARVAIELDRLQTKLDRQHEEIRKQLAKSDAARGADPASRRSA